MIRLRSLILILAQLFVLSSGPGGTYIAPHTRPAAPRPLGDGSETVVSTGTVSDFTRNNTTLDWHSIGHCVITPKLRRGAATDGDVAEAVSRVSTSAPAPI